MVGVQNEDGNIEITELLGHKGIYDYPNHQN